jgi:hypothetical protein
LTHELLTQRIPGFTSRRARFVGDEPPCTSQTGERICIHTPILFPDKLEVAGEFFHAPIR